MKNYLLFDIDDTLINTSKNAYQKHKRICQQLKQPSIDEEIYRSLFGRMSLEEMITQLLPKISISTYFSTYQQAKKYYPYSGIYPNLKEQILQPLLQNYHIGILTNGNKQKTEEKLTILQLSIQKDLFIVLHEENMGTKKPDPKVFDKVFEKIGNKSKKIVYIGDAPEDYEATVATPVDFYGVLSGVFSSGEFRKHGLHQDHILPDLYRLLHNLS